MTTPTPIVPPRVICNASVRQSYVPPKWNVREGANQHQQIQSKGLRT